MICQFPAQLAVKIPLFLNFSLLFSNSIRLHHKRSMETIISLDYGSLVGEIHML
jgi:hypothetical protein